MCEGGQSMQMQVTVHVQQVTSDLTKNCNVVKSHVLQNISGTEAEFRTLLWKNSRVLR